MNEEIGATVFCSKVEIRKPFKLSNHCSMCQAEIFALKLLQGVGFQKMNLHRYVHSQAAINAQIRSEKRGKCRRQSYFVRRISSGNEPRVAGAKTMGETYYANFIFICYSKGQM